MVDIDSKYKFIDIKNLIENKYSSLAIKTIERRNPLLPYYEVIRVNEESGEDFLI